MTWRFVWESLLVTLIFACGGPVPVAAQALEPIAANDPVVRENVETLYVLARDRFMRHSRWFEAFAENPEIVGISGEHHLFLTNAADVLREMQSFVSSLR